MPTTVHQLIWYAALLSTAGYASIRGGQPERQAAATLVVGSLVSVLVFQPHSRVQDGMLIVACLADAALLAIALTSNRWWPLFAVAFQILSTLALAVPPWDRATFNYAAYVDTVAWDYLTLTALVIGAYFEAQPPTA
jgi:hypothetical protein